MNSATKTVGTNITAPAILWPKNDKRTFLLIQNQSTDDVLVNVGAYPSINNGLKIPAGETWNPVNPPKGEIRMVGILANPVWQTVYSIEETA